MADLSPDWREFLSLLISHRVKFLIVGAHALAVHARPRMTEDLDVLVEASEANAKRLRRVLMEFGFGDAAPQVQVLAQANKVFMIGVPPYRIDILTSISGVSFERAWREREMVRFEMGILPVLSRRLLIENKRRAGRVKDLADLDMLKAQGRARKKRSP